MLDFPANNKWHPVYNGVPYKFLSAKQTEEIQQEYPTLDDVEQYLWARDADEWTRDDEAMEYFI